MTTIKVMDQQQLRRARCNINQDVDSTVQPFNWQLRLSCSGFKALAGGFLTLD